MRNRFVTISGITVEAKSHGYGIRKDAWRANVCSRLKPLLLRSSTLELLGVLYLAEGVPERFNILAVVLGYGLLRLGIVELRVMAFAGFTIAKKEVAETTFQVA